MKRAVILHGTDASPEANWFPWMKKTLEGKGYKVWVPFLPGNHTPNAKVYNDFLVGSGWDFTDNLVIGHSSGAVSVLNLLMDNRFPAIKTGVVVGSWHTCAKPWTPPEQFKDLFPKDGFDFEKIQSKSKKLIFVHGDNDPYCPIEQAKWLAEQTNSEIVTIPNGHHLGSKFKELPELVQILEKRNLL